jgi:signal transduction histidine kinase
MERWLGRVTSAGQAGEGVRVGLAPPGRFPAAPWLAPGAVRSVTAVLDVLLRPWREIRQTWWRLAHLVLGLPVGVAGFVPLVALSAVSLGLFITFPLAVPFIWLLFVTARGVSRVARSRCWALLGVELSDPVPPLTAQTLWGRFVQRFKTGSRWREIGYGLLLFPLGTLMFVVVVGVWSGSLALIGLPLYLGGLPEDTAHFGLFDVQGGSAWLATLVGIVGFVLVAPWTTVALADLDVKVARSLIGRSRRDEMDERVQQLETSRIAAVDSAEAERRRIERDLHDGAQQRLVSLAMNLGAARERMDSDPDGGQALVAEAHEEAKAALKDLRDLVRGFHPVILEDRGLDAALSAVVARAPIPVQLDVDVAVRPPPVIESTAYFVVAEALTNVARHAQASEAEVNIVRAGDRLVVEVRDDGIGGADSSRGTGLEGLQNRVSAVGGVMNVVSPEGGPTTLLVELPCGS